jgi:hypothetical protein
MMIEQLDYWAEGNLLYIGSTMFLLIQATISVLLHEENFYWVFAPAHLRTMSVVSSVFVLSSWLLAAVISTFLTIQDHEDGWDIIQAVINLYFLVMNLPILIPSLYIICKESLVDNVEIARRYYKKGYKIPDIKIERELENEDLAHDGDIDKRD